MPVKRMSAKGIMLLRPLKHTARTILRELLSGMNLCSSKLIFFEGFFSLERGRKLDAETLIFFWFLNSRLAGPRTKVSLM